MSSNGTEQSMESGVFRDREAAEDFIRRCREEKRGFSRYEIQTPERLANTATPFAVRSYW